eukprot:COSAG04_NODE_22345_length_356_cov_1.019455_1_plen_105_part_10
MLSRTLEDGGSGDSAAPSLAVGGRRPGQSGRSFGQRREHSGAPEAAVHALLRTSLVGAGHVQLGSLAGARSEPVLLGRSSSATTRSASAGSGSAAGCSDGRALLL